MDYPSQFKITPLLVGKNHLFEERCLSHSYARNYIHLVFSTKERNQTIKKEIQPRLWAYMATIYRNHDMIVKAVGGLDDHAHILFQLPASLALAKSVYLVKTPSSQWMKQFVKAFDWQPGYGAFSVSASQVESVVNIFKTRGAITRRCHFSRNISRCSRSMEWNTIRAMSLGKTSFTPLGFEA